MQVRTTIELSESHRQILHSLAQSRGYRGYSKILHEIIDFFFQKNPLNKKERHILLRLKGSWNSTDTNQVKSKIKEVRINWKK